MEFSYSQCVIFSETKNDCVIWKDIIEGPQKSEYVENLNKHMH